MTPACRRIIEDNCETIRNIVKCYVLFRNVSVNYLNLRRAVSTGLTFKRGHHGC